MFPKVKYVNLLTVNLLTNFKTIISWYATQILNFTGSLMRKIKDTKNKVKWSFGVLSKNMLFLRPTFATFIRSSYF